MVIFIFFKHFFYCFVFFEKKYPIFLKSMTKIAPFPQPNFAIWFHFLAIFQQPQGVQCCWKSGKKRNHIAKFGCGSGAILVILFKKMGYFFWKIRKKLKKIKKVILENMNIILSAYTLIYVSPKNIIFLEIFF